MVEVSSPTALRNVSRVSQAQNNQNLIHFITNMFYIAILETTCLLL
jgi:hypothetical protein